MSEEKKKLPQMGVKVIKSAAPVKKAETSTQLEDDSGFSEWLNPPAAMHGLENIVEHSSILPQCVRAYRTNIAGFGIGIRYKENVEETDEMKQEYELMEEVIDLLTIEKDTKEMFEDILEARETFGISYAEGIRTLEGKVESLEFIKNTASIRKTQPLDPYVMATYYYKGKKVTRRKKFRKYRQEIKGKIVYYKEWGDPRIMDKDTGEYKTELPIDRRANEIIEFPIGTSPYGQVRWIGQTLGIDGSRKAEELNNRYFSEGRHTPLLIMIKGGTLSDNSMTELQGYMNDIKGENGQHAFVIIEAESGEASTDLDDVKHPEIEVKDMAAVLQKDELFQGYLDNNRKKAQSAFLLPDVYVAYTSDYNRATSQTAMEITEEQVFQPERISLAWILNNKILVDYGFKHVEAYFKAPNISNPDDIAKILNITERAGGLTPDKAKEITLAIFGEVAENYPPEWGSTPLQYIKAIASPGQLPTAAEVEALSGAIQKAKGSTPEEVVAVMKEVRAVLLQLQKGEQECSETS